MADRHVWLALFVCVPACSGGPAAPADGSRPPAPDGGPACVPRGATESACGDNLDDDCDGLLDCVDPDCESQACGAPGDMCTGGRCLHHGVLPDLPPIENVRVQMHGDTAVVDFEPYTGALDYRIYPEPAAGDVLVGSGGAIAVQNAIYRCGGDRQYSLRDGDDAFQYSLHGGDEYMRSDAEAAIGYVYVSPAADRIPVYRLADPRADAENSPGVAAYAESRNADYVTDEAQRAMLLSQGWRDDGIAFYTSRTATRTVYRFESLPGIQDRRHTVYFVDGPEHDAYQSSDRVDQLGPRFQILAAPADGAVALYRVYYAGGHDHDVLVAGDERFQLALHQGNRPVTFLSWPGLTAQTTLVIEALDQGCPWPNGYIGPSHVDGDPPVLALDEARLTGSREVFINGQHDPANRPRPVARSYVTVTPEPHPVMDWFESFDVAGSWPAFAPMHSNSYDQLRSPDWSIDFSYCSSDYVVGPMLGQLVTSQGDWGAGCHLRMTPRGIDTALSADSFLHLTMQADIPSTGRRYPQILISTVPLGDEPIQDHLAEGYTVVVEPIGVPFGPVDPQLQFCDHFQWNVNAQCDHAHIYGRDVDSYDDTRPYSPVPVVAELAGYDRPVKFDVYASSQRVYLFLDDQPVGCGIYPATGIPPGPVTVAFGSVIYHSGIDEWVVNDNSPQQFLSRYSLTQTSHHFDDLGIERSVAAPAWDESVLPCATDWIN